MISTCLTLQNCFRLKIKVVLVNAHTHNEEIDVNCGASVYFIWINDFCKWKREIIAIFADGRDSDPSLALLNDCMLNRQWPQEIY